MNYLTPKKLTLLEKKRSKNDCQADRQEGPADTIGGLLFCQSSDQESSLTELFSGLCTSSGGPWLKDPGRVGSSALKSAGFDIGTLSDTEIGLCLASGHGENIIERLLSGHALRKVKKHGFIPDPVKFLKMENSF